MKEIDEKRVQPEPQRLLAPQAYQQALKFTN